MFKIVIVAVIVATSQMGIYVSKESFPTKEKCEQVLSDQIKDIQTKLDKSVGPGETKIDGVCGTEDEIKKLFPDAKIEDNKNSI